MVDAGWLHEFASTAILLRWCFPRAVRGVFTCWYTGSNFLRDILLACCYGKDSPIALSRFAACQEPLARNNQYDLAFTLHSQNEVENGWVLFGLFLLLFLFFNFNRKCKLWLRSTVHMTGFMWFCDYFCLRHLPPPPHPQFTFCLIFMTDFPLEGLGILEWLSTFLQCKEGRIKFPVPSSSLSLCLWPSI